MNQRRTFIAIASLTLIAGLTAPATAQAFSTGAGGASAKILAPGAALQLATASPSYANVGPRGTGKASFAQTFSSTSPSSAAAAVPLPGVDTIGTFTGDYTVPNVDSFGNPNNNWTYDLVGKSPRTSDDTTTYRAPLIPVIARLHNADGSIAYTVDPTGTVDPIVKSPVFANAKYTSSKSPTQFTDALLRAEFPRAETGWHTRLVPKVRATRYIDVPNGAWKVGKYTDGSLAYTLIDEYEFFNLMFPTTTVDNSTLVGAAELSGDITTKDISTFLFDNVFLYNPFSGGCCILGFHSFDYELGDASNGNRERNYVLNYSSWVTPGLFGPNFSDATVLSHEMAEIFHDPFVGEQPWSAAVPYGITPWWLAPNGNCQNNMEVGDVVEGLPNSTTVITTNGYGYHMQNEALLQWFTSQPKSSALGGAYSYPDTSVLTSANVPQNLYCAP